MSEDILSIQEIKDTTQNARVLNQVVTSLELMTPLLATDGNSKSTLTGYDELVKTRLEEQLVVYGGFTPTGPYQAETSPGVGGYSYIVNNLFDEDGTTYLVTSDFTSSTFSNDDTLNVFTIQQGLNISTGVVKITSVFDTVGFSKLEVGTVINMVGYHDDTTIGGGSGVGAIARHNGGTTISKTRTRPTDWTDQTQLESWFLDSGSDELCFVRSGVSQITPEQYGARGDFYNQVGTNDTLAFQKCLDTNVNVQADRDYYTTKTLDIKRDHCHLHGRGSLQCMDFPYEGSTLDQGFVKCTGFNSKITDLRLYNPQWVGGFTDGSGNPTYGTGGRFNFPAVNLFADSCKAQHLFIHGFNRGIQDYGVNGDVYESDISHNRIVVLGTGAGPDDYTDAGGENTGDGIYYAGGRGACTSNTITALGGTDARCAIFAEWLNGFPAERHTQLTLNGNVLFGQNFRRILDVEAYYSVAGTGNSLRGGSWATIQISGGTKHSSFTGNTVEYIRSADNWSGDAYSPWRTAVMVYAATENVTLGGSVVVVSGYGNGITINGVGPGSSVIDTVTVGDDVIVDFPNVTTPRGIGVVISHAKDVKFNGEIKNSTAFAARGGLPVDYDTYGIKTNDVESLKVRSDSIEVIDPSSGAGLSYGIRCDSLTGRSLVLGTTITANVGISSYAGMSKMKVAFCDFINASTIALDLFGSTDCMFVNNDYSGYSGTNKADGVDGCVIKDNIA